MDLAKGHVLSLDALAKDVSEGIFKTTDTSKSGYYRDMINAMKKASGFDFQYEIVGRRCVLLSSSSCLSSFPILLLFYPPASPPLPPPSSLASIDTSMITARMTRNRADP
jgi:hypothetical protein